MKITAQAPANIAFLKYWGKTDDALRIPANSSFSMNLSEAITTTTVEFSDALSRDVVEFEGDSLSEHEISRIVHFLDLVRDRAGVRLFARVRTKNSFPKGAGVASSASGFAALAVASVNAIGLSLSEKELSILARLGSGSACRSIPDGFVRWEKGQGTSDTSFAHSVAPADFWDIRDILCIVDPAMKKVSTTDGHTFASTSPLWNKRMEQLPSVDVAMMDAFWKKDFSIFGQIVEGECDNMHAVMQSQTPPLYYWSDATVNIMEKVKEWRAQGVSVYYTIDAGANVHVLCEQKNEAVVAQLAGNCAGVLRIVINRPANGARVIHSHLF